jgi:hypothetical protein
MWGGKAVSASCWGEFTETPRAAPGRCTLRPRSAGTSTFRGVRHTGPAEPACGGYPPPTLGRRPSLTWPRSAAIVFRRPLSPSAHRRTTDAVPHMARSLQRGLGKRDLDACRQPGLRGNRIAMGFGWGTAKHCGPPACADATELLLSAWGPKSAAQHLVPALSTSNPKRSMAGIWYQGSGAADLRRCDGGYRLLRGCHHDGRAVR